MQVQLQMMQMQAAGVPGGAQQIPMGQMPVLSMPDYSGVIKSKALDYSGNESCLAVPLRLAELIPGLPPAELAASVDALQSVRSACCSLLLLLPCPFPVLVCPCLFCVRSLE